MNPDAKPSVVSYVLRIYRRTPGCRVRPETLAGVVENTHDNQQSAFHTMAELWEILHANSGKSVPAKHAPAHNDKPGRLA